MHFGKRKMKQRITSLYDIEAIVLFLFVANAYLLNPKQKYAILALGFIAVMLLHFRLSAFLQSLNPDGCDYEKGRFEILKNFCKREFKIVIFGILLLIISLTYSFG